MENYNLNRLSVINHSIHVMKNTKLVNKITKKPRNITNSYQKLFVMFTHTYLLFIIRSTVVKDWEHELKDFPYKILQSMCAKTYQSAMWLSLTAMDPDVSENYELLCSPRADTENNNLCKTDQLTVLDKITKSISYDHRRSLDS